MGERSADLLEYRDEMQRKALRQTSIDKATSLLVRVEHALGHPLIESTHLELRDWLDRQNIGAKTRYLYISHLSAFWKWALIEERATKNPVLRLTRPKVRQGLPRPIAPNDLATLLQLAPTTEIRAMINLAAFAGLRCMEIAGLCADEIGQHLEPPSLIVRHGKGDKPRVIPISNTTVEALRAHGIPAYGPIFHDEGRPYTPAKVSHILRSYIHDCGISASAHQLRHAFGTEMYRRSMGDLRMVQTLMGHSSPTTTAGYTQWNQDKAAAIIDTLFT